MALIVHTMAAKYTSFRIVIDKILRDSLFNGLNYEAAVDYCIDFINIVGLPYTFEEKHLETEIVDYRCQLPPDYVGVIQVMINQAKDVLSWYENMTKSIPTWYKGVIINK